MKGYILSNSGTKSVVFKTFNDVLKYLKGNKDFYQVCHIIGEVDNYLQPEREIKLSFEEKSRMKNSLKLYGRTRTGVYYGSFEFFIKSGKKEIIVVID